MKIYNTLSRKVEEIVPGSGGKINMFVCGPTVYDEIHIGNARTFVFFDSLVKYLRYRGFLVFYLLNITDVDDKIIKKAEEESVSAEQISSRYYRSFERSMQRLRVDSVSVVAPSSRFVDEIISQIARLMEKGFAYAAEDGVYFRVERFSDYGNLSGQKTEQLIPGARVQATATKESFMDFALWKFRKPGEPFWNSPWGEGRPGWHIEDTAITEYYFGPTYDIHGAGSDLIFPHHEAEVAQMRSISGKELLSRYWIHTGMLNMTEEKMSKSLGNIVKINEVLDRYSAEDIRFFFLNSSYRSTLEYNSDRIGEASASRSKIQNLYEKLKEVRNDAGSFTPDIKSARKRMVSVLDDDFDTRTFFRDLLEFSSDVFRNFDGLSVESASEITRFLDEVDSVFGIISHEVQGAGSEELVNGLLNFRNMLRERKMYDLSDELRRIMKESGLRVEDN